MMKKRGSSSVLLVVSHLFSVGLGATLTCLLLMMNGSQSPNLRPLHSHSAERGDNLNANIHNSSAPSNDYALPVENFSAGIASGVTIGPEHDPTVIHYGMRYAEAEEPSGQQVPSTASCPDSCPCLNRKKLTVDGIVFGIASSSELWKDRQEFIKLWWKPGKTRGYVFLDKQPAHIDLGEIAQGIGALNLPTRNAGGSAAASSQAAASAVSSEAARHVDELPEIRISSLLDNTSRSSMPGPRISRIVSEMFHMQLPGVSWFVLGDDDTIFCVENLVRVLNQYDHNQLYYLGSKSETHQQNVFYSTKMAFGGGGIAISYSLARLLAQTQDDCLLRSSKTSTSDAHLHACISELGVPLTKVDGFHQTDLRGNIVGLLQSHPIAPFLSLHHLSDAAPVFPGQPRMKATAQLVRFMKAYPAGFLQQSLCFDSSQNATVSIAWGLTVRWLPGPYTVREMDRAERTFLAWNYGKSPYEFAIDTREHTVPICNIPAVFHVAFVSKPRVGDDGNLWVESEYHRGWLLRRLRPPMNGGTSRNRGWRKIDPKTGEEVSAEAEAIGKTATGDGAKKNAATGTKEGSVKVDGPKRRLLFGELCPNGLRRVPNPVITVVRVRARVLPDSWFNNPRRQCCKRFVTSVEEGVAEIELGPCVDGEVIAAV